MVRPKRRLVDICRSNTNLMIPRAQVQLGEEFGAVQLIQEFLTVGIILSKINLSESDVQLYLSKSQQDSFILKK
jgi:hypothetical protein